MIEFERQIFIGDFKYIILLQNNNILVAKFNGQKTLLVAGVVEGVWLIRGKMW